MHILKLIVRSQLISYKECRLLVADSLMQAYVEFDFDEEWNGLICTANFENSSTGKTVSVLLTERQVPIPPEVLVPGYLQISVVGLANNGAKQVPTAKMDTPIKVYAAGPAIGALPEGVTPEIWEQLLALIGDVSKLDTSHKDSIVGAINELSRRPSGQAGVVVPITPEIIHLKPMPIVGDVDAEKNVILSGLPEGTYTFFYKMSDGALVKIDTKAVT